MKLSGSFVVTVPQADVYNFLTDPACIAPALPDIESYEIHDPETFTVNAQVGISFIRGVMKVKMKMIEKSPTTHAAFKGQASGLGSSAELNAGFELTDGPDGGTTVNWTGEAKVGGRLASVAGGLLEPIAKKNLAKFIDAVQQALMGIPAPVQEA